MLSKRRLLAHIILFAAIVLFSALPAHAATGGGTSMPWDTALTNILANLQGTVVRICILIAVMIGAILWAFTDHATGVRRLSQVIVAAGVGLGGVSFLSGLGIGGALL